MPIPQRITELVARFQRDERAIRAGALNETQTRREYIDPLLQALGWDIDNSEDALVANRDVIHEDRVRIEGRLKAPDYALYVGGVRKFFVEAKPPTVNLDTDPEPAFQVKRYAWSAGLPISVVTDFEEFVIYDCREQPNREHPAGTARLDRIHYTEYAARWDEIAARFGKQAVIDGALDEFASTLRTRRGMQTVDDAFLAELSRWREQLAQDINARNQVTQRELNYAVQMTLNRLLFLRVAEDRGIEVYGRLQATANEPDVYTNLCRIFQEADDRYNSGLFHFRKERERDEPDALTPGLQLSDNILHAIINGMYYPAPYAFALMPVEVLGQVYEQFLGSIIVKEPNGDVQIQEKPEVRHAGGVYYTPTYIVNYIVRETVGRLVAGKTPTRVAKLRIVDPACGSGSFLLGAYQYLLNWHRDWYIQDGPARHRQQMYQGHAGEWLLTAQERKRILTNNIFGVDIDPQAVEVTKLSLLLQVLEGETERSIAVQLRLLHERALPDLDSNIKCGNTLIEPNMYAGEQMQMWSEDELYRINAFDWNEAFPQIMRSGGFDVVIGNPPYIRIQEMVQWAPTEVVHYRQKYATARRGNYDIYVVFVERALQLLNAKGRMGYILPHKFMNSEYGEPLRQMLSGGRNVSTVIHFGDQQVFRKATTYTCLLFLEKAARRQFEWVRPGPIAAWRSDERAARKRTLPAERLGAAEWNISVDADAELFERVMASTPLRLGDVADIFVGLQTSADNVYIMDLIEERGENLVLRSQVLGENVIMERGLLHPVVSGVDVTRYAPLPARQFILFPYTVENEQATLIPIETIALHYPHTAEYLGRNRDRLEGRERGAFRDETWYRFGRNQNLGIQERTKLCIPRLVEYLYTTYDRDGSFYLDNVDVCGITFKATYRQNDLLYLLALLNSQLMRWIFPKVSAPFRGGFWSANKQFSGQLPFRRIDETRPQDVRAYQDLVAAAASMLDWHSRFKDARTPQARQVASGQITALETRIDTCVFDLYGLSPEERAVVAGADPR
jgi:type I restriction-modification system DNA methylase subunit